MRRRGIIALIALATGIALDAGAQTPDPSAAHEQADGGVAPEDRAVIQDLELLQRLDLLEALDLYQPTDGGVDEGGD